MKTHHLFAAALILWVSGSASSASECALERIAPATPARLGPWIKLDNWQDPGHLRITQPVVADIMPALRITPPHTAPTRLQRPPRINLHQKRMTDPADGSSRDLAFILDQRLYADALVAIQGNRVMAEYYRDDVDPATPRPLLAATLPILSILAASAIADGRLAADKSITRALSVNPDVAALRKLSVRRLLEREAAFAWPPDQRHSWQQAAGWAGGGREGIRAWLLDRNQWNAPFSGKPQFSPIGAPEDDLLARVITAARGIPIAQLFCETLLAPMQAEGMALWLTDRNGEELAAGAALTPVDFARLGQSIFDSRGSTRHLGIPDWLTSALASPRRVRSGVAATGFPDGSEFRYGFLRLGGPGSRIVLLGAYGTSLFVDLERKIAIALFASYPAASSPLLYATLDAFWSAMVKELATPNSQQR